MPKRVWKVMETGAGEIRMAKVRGREGQRGS